MNMTDSQFKTFRADVKREVRNIAHEIRSELYKAVVEDSRRAAAATARKHVDQIALNGELYDLSDLRNAVTNLNESVAAAFVTLNNVEGRLTTVEHKLTEKASLKADRMSFTTAASGLPEWTTSSPPKEWDVIAMNGERFTFYRGEWRRDSQMKEFARQARYRSNTAVEKFRAAQSDVHKFAALGL